MPLSIRHPYPGRRQEPPTVPEKASVPYHKTLVCARVHLVCVVLPMPAPCAMPRSAISAQNPNGHQCLPLAHLTVHTTIPLFPTITLDVPLAQSFHLPRSSHPPSTLLHTSRQSPQNGCYRSPLLPRSPSAT